MEINIHENEFTTLKTTSDGKKWKYETFSFSEPLLWRQKWVVGVRQGNFIVICRVSPGSEQNMLLLVKLNPEFLSELTEQAKET